MITVGMHYDVVEGREPDFEAKFQSVLDVLGKDPSHVRTHLYRRVDSPTTYAIMSEWESGDAFRAFIRGDMFREVAGWGRAGILKSRPRHEIYGGREDL